MTRIYLVVVGDSEPPGPRRVRIASHPHDRASDVHGNRSNSGCTNSPGEDASR